MRLVAHRRSQQMRERPGSVVLRLRDPLHLLDLLRGVCRASRQVRKMPEDGFVFRRGWRRGVHFLPPCRPRRPRCQFPASRAAACNLGEPHRKRRLVAVREKTARRTEAAAIFEEAEDSKDHAVHEEENSRSQPDRSRSFSTVTARFRVNRRQPTQTLISLNPCIHQLSSLL